MQPNWEHSIRITTSTKNKSWTHTQRTIGWAAETIGKHLYVLCIVCASLKSFLRLFVCSAFFPIFLFLLKLTDKIYTFILGHFEYNNKNDKNRRRRRKKANEEIVTNNYFRMLTAVCDHNNNNKCENTLRNWCVVFKWKRHRATVTHHCHRRRQCRAFVCSVCWVSTLTLGSQYPYKYGNILAIIAQSVIIIVANHNNH